MRLEPKGTDTEQLRRSLWYSEVTRSQPWGQTLEKTWISRSS